MKPPYDIENFHLVNFELRQPAIVEMKKMIICRPYEPFTGFTETVLDLIVVWEITECFPPCSDAVAAPDEQSTRRSLGPIIYHVDK